MTNYIHASKNAFINYIVRYITKNYSNKINKIVVFGDSVNKDIRDPQSLDIAVGLVDKSDAKDYNMLGDILSYMGEIVTEGDCTLTPIADDVVKKSYMNEINHGVTVYDTSNK